MKSYAVAVGLTGKRNHVSLLRRNPGIAPDFGTGIPSVVEGCIVAASPRKSAKRTMNASISLKPSGSETKSSIWAIDRESCGADAFGAPSKKNSSGTCRIMGDLLQSAGPDAVGAPLVFQYLYKSESERVT